VRNVLILGSTGSIGKTTLDVLWRNRDSHHVWGLVANTDAALMFKQILTHDAQFAAMSDPQAGQDLARQVAEHGLPAEVLSGPQAAAELAAHPEADTVVAAIVGAAGLGATFAAAEAGKRVLLANKESLVCGGRLLLEAAARSGAVLLPIDSEHNAILQCMPPAGERGAVERIWLTASGGPFRGWSMEQLKTVRPEQACRHPNWRMGRKISVDSATMMNKGLELIEAHWLFGLPVERIEVLLHPQSIVHSMVQYRDGSLLAQLGEPDMRTPIACALDWPERLQSGGAAATPGDWVFNFATLDADAYPCFVLAREVAQKMGAAPAVLNAANEVAVAAFLDGALGFTDIAAVVAGTLEKLDLAEPASLEEVFYVDAQARSVAGELLVRYQR